MATDYEERLTIPIQGDNHTRFFTKTGLYLATGYERVVIGDRGPYVEFLSEQMIHESLHMPEDCKYRTTPKHKHHVYYYEYRSTDASYVKVYHQRRTVGYADYIVGLYYISPFDLFVDGDPVITDKDSDQFTLMDYLPPDAKKAIHRP